MSLEADERERTVNFVLTDELGETIWSSGQVHLKTEKIEESGGFAGFGSLTMLLAGIVGGIVFISFFIYMIALIYRRRRTLDEIEDMDEEEIVAYGSVSEPTAAVVVQQQPVAQMPVQPTMAAPGPMPAAAPDTSRRTRRGRGPLPHNRTWSSRPGWSPRCSCICGVRSRSTDVQIQELRGVSSTSVDDAFNALGGGSAEQAQNSTLPTFNCIVTGNVLTAADAWWQCTGCGGFAASTAIATYTHCPACNLAR